jgi:hypothetical protein
LGNAVETQVVRNAVETQVVLDYAAMADAVIAALNLTTPVEYLSVDGSRQNYRVAGHYTEDVNDD